MGDKFRPQHHETILFLQYCKLIKQSKETAKEWMWRLRIKAVQWNYKQNDRCLKEQFINGIKSDAVTCENCKEFTVVKNASEIIGDTVLISVRRVEAQRSRTEMLENLNKNDGLDAAGGSMKEKPKYDKNKRNQGNVILKEYHKNASIAGQLINYVDNIEYTLNPAMDPARPISSRMCAGKERQTQ